MKFILLLIAFFLVGCPKTPHKTLEEIQREEDLQELLEQEDEIWDDLPEAGEESSEDDD